MIEQHDHGAGTITFRCEHCRCKQTLTHAAVERTPENLVLRCRVCHSTEHLPLELTAYHAGEVAHPESMTGYVWDEFGSICTEDARYDLPPHAREQARLIRELQRALGLPLAELPTPATPIAATSQPLVPAPTTPDAPHATPASDKSQIDTLA